MISQSLSLNGAVISADLTVSVDGPQARFTTDGDGAAVSFGNWRSLYRFVLAQKRVSKEMGAFKLLRILAQRLDTRFRVYVRDHEVLSFDRPNRRNTSVAAKVRYLGLLRSWLGI